MQLLCSTESDIGRIEKTLFVVQRNECHYQTNGDNDIQFDTNVCHSATNLEKKYF